MNETPLNLRIIYQMFTLVTQKCGFFRIKRGQNEDDIAKVLGAPVAGGAFAGRIIAVDGRYEIYSAEVGDTYRSVAEAFGADAEELEKINSGVKIYPTRKIFVPKRQ